MIIKLLQKNTKLLQNYHNTITTLLQNYHYTITKLLQNYRKTITNDYKTITKIFFTQLK